MPARTLQALIFDVDGTLADTESAHRAAFNQAFAEAGKDWFWDEALYTLSLIHISEPTRLRRISYAVFCLKKKTKNKKKTTQECVIKTKEKKTKKKQKHK